MGGGQPAADGRRHAPSAARNTAPIADVLATQLPRHGKVLELAAGTGQHAVAFAARFPGLLWQPTDIDPQNLDSIRAWARMSPTPGLCAPRLLDACAPEWAADWPGQAAVLVVNLLHLIPDAAAATLLAEVPQALARDGVFCLYGPFRRNGALHTDGDLAFDARLRAQDPAIGYKDIGWVSERLAQGGLQAQTRVDMPAGNLMLIARSRTHRPHVRKNR